MDLWDKTLEALRTSVEPYDFKHWIRPIRCDAVDERDQEITLAVSDDSHGRWVEENFLPEIRSALRRFTDHDYAVRFKTTHEAPPSTPSALSALSERQGRAPTLSCPNGGPNGDPNGGLGGSADLIGDYRFGTFVHGPTNLFAVTAAQSAAQHPGQRYNPLFLYGGVGLGKTHILHAIGWEALAVKPDARIVYVTSETFVNDLIEAIRSDRMRSFRARYRDRCDVLLVDDIQFIAGKDRTQEEFFHLFNTLYSANKQIVLSSDRMPQAMLDLKDRLKSRLQWGLIANIDPPSFETRVAILKRKAEANDFYLDDEVAKLVAHHVTRNVRELEGALLRLRAHVDICRTGVDLATAKQILGDIVSESIRRTSPEAAVKAVCQEFRVTLAELKGPRRHRSVTVPRQVAMFLIRELTLASLPQIGNLFGGRDHSTVLNAIRRVEQLSSADPELKSRIDALRGQLGK